MSVDSAAARVRAEASQSLKAIGSIQIVDFVLFALLVVGVEVPGIGLPVSQIITFVIVLRGIAKRSQFDAEKLQPLVVLFGAALFYLGFISLFADFSDGAADWHKRLLRLFGMTLLILVITTGRVDVRSGILGVCAGLLVNVPLFYAGLVSDNYGGYLTGLLDDKNYAGLMYCLFGVLVVIALRRRWHQIASFAVFSGMLWLTGSRTSLAAFVAAAAWVLLAPRLPMLARWALGAAIYFAVNLVSEDFSQVGVFSNRTGSDLLRARIDAASELKVDATGFFGRGLGEAYVHIQGDNWFFHNSYWSAQVEGGWPWLLFVVGVTVLLVVRPFHRPQTLNDAAVQAAGIALLICAWRLGEVFYTLPWAIVVGISLQRMCRSSVEQHSAPGKSPHLEPIAAQDVAWVTEA